MNTWIIIPTYNEALNIEKLIDQIFQQPVDDLFILVVDDNSPDKTGDIVENLRNKFTNLHVLRRAGKQGLGSAYKAGFDYALKQGADFIFEMDADFSHDPHDIPRLLKATQDGADLTIGSRKIKGGRIIGWNARRHFFSNSAMLFSRLILGLRTHDLTAGFRCFRKQTLLDINYQTVASNGYAFQEEILYRVEKSGLTVTEIPVTFPDRTAGESKLGLQDIVEFFKTIIKLRFKS